MRTPAPLAVAALLSLAACGDDSVRPGGSPGITFPVGAGISDTVDATPVQALRIQVRGSDGRPAMDEVVRVEGVLNGLDYYEALVAGLGGRYFQPFLADTTDEDGVVHVQVRLGRSAGPARVAVTAPALGLQDTARFEILPGGPAVIQGTPIDVAVPIGRTLTLTMRVTDRYGNPRNEAVTYATSGTAASLDGNVVTGRAFGRSIITASAGTLHTTAALNVVPVGMIAFSSHPAMTGELSAIYTANLDGSELTQRATSAAGPGWWPMPMSAAWLSATELMYSDEVSSRRPLHVLDIETGESRRFLPPAQQMEIEQHPRLSHDRNWLFFSGGTDRGYWLYRVRPTGADFARISPEDAPLSHWTPAPSPDGTRVAYKVQGAWEGGFEIRDLASGEVRHIPVDGDFPSWSPDGTQIAYLSGYDLRSVRPDGTGDRSLTAQPHVFSGRMDWSPDGAYIVGTVDYSRLAIVEVATGEVLSVAIMDPNWPLVSPVWRPGAP